MLANCMAFKAHMLGKRYANVLASCESRAVCDYSVFCNAGSAGVGAASSLEARRGLEQIFTDEAKERVCA
jgi:hypothetical protein